MKNLLAVFLHATSHPNDKIKPSYYKHTHTFSSMFPLHFVPVTFFLSYHITCYIQHFFFVFFPLFCVSFYHQNPSQNGMEVEYCLISFSSHLSLSFFPAMLLNLSLFLFTFYLFFLSGYISYHICHFIFLNLLFRAFPPPPCHYTPKRGIGL